MKEKKQALDETDVLAGPALRAFFNIAEVWSMNDDEQMGVLGIHDPTMLECWREGVAQGFSSDTLERISYVLGIFKGINTLLPEPIHADAWVRSPNNGWLFAGKPALELITSGNVSDLADVRQYLEAQINP